jgi:hypothetical protein
VHLKYRNHERVLVVETTDSKKKPKSDESPGGSSGQDGKEKREGEVLGDYTKRAKRSNRERFRSL